MKIINAEYKILTPISEGGIEELKRIEQAARICYKSEELITEDGKSAKRLVKNLIKNGHEAAIEHSQLSVKFICDRGVSHEIVRSRLASYCQESTRFCSYDKDKFGNEITVIRPFFLKKYSTAYMAWENACKAAEEAYFELLNIGNTPQEARSVLPNSLKTELVMTANYREWRTFLKLRTDKAAHPQMQELTRPLLDELKNKIPIIFDDITYDEV